MQNVAPWISKMCQIDNVMNQVGWDLQKIQPAVLVLWIVLER